LRAPADSRPQAPSASRSSRSTFSSHRTERWLRGEAVGQARVQVAAFARHARRQRQRGDDAQQLLDAVERKADARGGAQEQRRNVRVQQAHEVGGRNARDHAVERRVQRRQETRGVGTQRHAVHAQRGSTAPLPQPADQAPHVVHRLRLGVNRVEEVARQEPVAAASAHAPRPVQRKHRNRHVERELAMQPARAKAREVDGGSAHAIARNADQPRPRLALVL
jgi:hypothetical protein